MRTRRAVAYTRKIHYGCLTVEGLGQLLLIVFACYTDKHFHLTALVFFHDSVSFPLPEA
jgi:hypothetical protein